MIPTRISFEQLNELILGFYHSGAYDTSISTKDAALRASMKYDIAGRQTKFLVAIGIIARESQGFRLTDNGYQYARFLDFKQEDEASTTLATILKDYEISKKIVQFVHVTEPLPKIDVILRVGLITGSKNNPMNRRGFMCFVDMLLYAKLIYEDQNQNISVQHQTSVGKEIPPSYTIVEKPPIMSPFLLELILKIDSNTELANFRLLLKVIKEELMENTDTREEHQKKGG